MAASVNSDVLYNTTDWDMTYGITQSMNDSYMSTGTLPSIPIADINMPIVRIICEVGISLPIAILGIIGNILAFVVLWRLQKQRPMTTNLLLQSLAVTDTLVLISSILLRSMRYVGWDSFNDIHHYLFVFLYPFVYFFRLADTWLTVMMTVDRYIAVCHPLQAQRVCTMKRTYMTIALIMLTTFLFSLPRFFEYTIREGKHNQGFYNTPLVTSQMYTLGYRIVCFFLVMYLIPMMLLIVLNVRLLCTLRKAQANRSSMISNGTHNGKSVKALSQKSNRGVTVIVVTVVLVCVTCNISAMTTHVVWSLQMCFLHLRYLEYHRRFLANVTNILVTFNCAINFVIYCLFSRKFRVGLSQMCNCDCASKISRRWRSDRHSESSGAVNTSYTSVGLLPMRGPVKTPTHIIQHKISADL